VEELNREIAELNASLGEKDGKMQ
jgi:hypothetical protein